MNALHLIKNTNQVDQTGGLGRGRERDREREREKGRETYREREKEREEMINNIKLRGN